jgi:PAS domain S-box-containing protein
MNKELRILILEDVPTDTELVEYELRKAEISFSSKRVETREDFIKALEEYAPDLILSDHTLPSFDGMEALKIAKEKSPDVPFIFVTGSLGEEGAIETLKSGATDYVLKDNLSRLAPSVRRALREAEERREHKRALEALKDSQALLAGIVDSAMDAIISLDSQQRIVHFNRAAEKMFGYSSSDIIGQPVDILIPERFRNAHREHIKTFGDYDVTNRTMGSTGGISGLRSNGEEFPIEASISQVEALGQKIFTVILRDVTDRKKLEAQFLRAQRMESIGTLAGGIAHDLNNVLQPIMMALQLLRNTYKDEKSQVWIDTLESSATRGANLVKQVLSFARGVEVERTIIQTRYVIAEAGKIAKETFPKNIEIKTDIPKDLWTIQGDVTQLHQVLMNILVNARDAMTNGGILSISGENFYVDENYAQVHMDAKVGPHVVITVSDTGIGIPPELRDKIFEPFFTTKELEEGTGLGLSTAYGIVKGHGGFINVYSEIGKGTRFKVHLPAAETNETKKIGEKQIDDILLGHGELILIVDDEPSVQEIARVTLETYGYRVMTGTDGAEAIALYAQHLPDIKAVVLDMMMPIMDGPSCIRALRKVDPDARIIAVSGLKEHGRFGDVDSTDVHAFLSKPFTAEVLLRTLRKVLDTK